MSLIRSDFQILRSYSCIDLYWFLLISRYQHDKMIGELKSGCRWIGILHFQCEETHFIAEGGQGGLVKVMPGSKMAGSDGKKRLIFITTVILRSSCRGRFVGLEICDHRLSVPDSPRKVSGTGRRPANTGVSERNWLRQKQVETRNLGNKREFM